MLGVLTFVDISITTPYNATLNFTATGHANIDWNIYVNKPFIQYQYLNVTKFLTGFGNTTFTASTKISLII